MPFITRDRRELIDKGGLELLDNTPGYNIQPGDRCYVFYKDMVQRWQVSRRWTTAHEIFRDLIHVHENTVEDDYCAAVLAWHVFFQLHVMPYEREKLLENGNIT